MKAGTYIARDERNRERRDQIVQYILLSISLITAFSFLILLFVEFFNLTGYSASVESQGGYISELLIEQHFPVYQYAGAYGLALRVSGFGEQPYQDLGSGEIRRADAFFDCIKLDAPDGPEVYASTSPVLDFSDVRPGTQQMVDAFNNCSDSIFCANNTFTGFMNITLGETRITGIPSTYTYKYTGEQTIFDIGVLNVSGKLVFVSHINASVQKGYSQGVTVNYQMLLPTPEDSTQRYYFFTDPFDICPAGGVGNNIAAGVFGLVSDTSNNTLENVTINVVGYSNLSNASGFYNLSFTAMAGTYILIAQKEGYEVFIDNITINFSSYVIEKNIIMVPRSPSGGQPFTPLVYGMVRDTSGVPLPDVNISLGNSSTNSTIFGNYSFYPTVIIGKQALVAYKEGYNNYFALINFTTNISVYEHNITLSPVNLNVFPSGPYAQIPVQQNPLIEIPEIIEKTGDDYWISTKEIKRQVRKNTFVEEKVGFYNFGGGNKRLLFSLSSNLKDFVKLDSNSLNVLSGTSTDLTITIYGTPPVGIYKGNLMVSGDINQNIPIEIEIVDKKLPIETLTMDIDLFSKVVKPASDVKYKLTLKNFLMDQSYKVNLKHSIVDANGTKTYSEKTEIVEIKNSLALLRDLSLPKDIPDGNYMVKVEATYFNFISNAIAPFTVSTPIYLYSFFGIPLWIILLGIFFLSFVLFNFYLYKAYKEKKKRYHLSLHVETLPKAGERSIKLGKLAETNIPAYYDLDMLTTHAIIAGATGGGKSISAQVIIEEALLKNIAIIVFDPTAQWSGMLRKCEDKKMFALYPKFGLKPSDAKAFPGNVIQIKNSRQAIDIKKYMNPGHIQIFALNKLDPSEMDTFVSTVITSIFRSGPEEHPGLRVMMVFDEVHRLLPKFGGSGKGFLQIERACREFRKWGFGVMLVSQVLSDFVGEIKANINTEVQMRVAEEKDLERIRERYGPDALRSLVRADVGVGMVQNAEYNRGLPYFVAFRPILHNTRRLSDEILEKYNHYSEVIEDLEYQIEQLEAEKVDTFDLKMELKLVKDKLMTGSFSVVDIYLEGLLPRIQKQWQNIGKKPKKKELVLVEEKALEAELAKAAADRQKWEAENKKAAAPVEEKKEDKVAKIVKPITFDNGMAASSLKELKEILPGLEEDIFSEVVNEEKNQIADWVKQNIDADLGEKLSKLTDKRAIVSALDSYGKPEAKEEEKKDDKKEEKKDDKTETKKEKKKDETAEKKESENKTDKEKTVNKNDKKAGAKNK